MFRYVVLTIPTQQDMMLKLLNDFGKQGWQVVQLFNIGSHNQSVLLMREESCVLKEGDRIPAGVVLKDDKGGVEGLDYVKVKDGW